MADPFFLYRNMADLFKTPGKLKGKTPRTGKKTAPGEARVVSNKIPGTRCQGGCVLTVVLATI